MRLRDYRVYHATFEPCVVSGNNEGFKAVIHTEDMDIVTYGIDFANTVKMSQAIVTDMAHAMSFEEMIPAALPVSKVNVPEDFLYRSNPESQVHDRTEMLFCSVDVNQHLKDLFKNADTPSVATNPADPSYVNLPKQDDDEHAPKQPTITVAIQLPLETAFKIVIANEMLMQHTDLSTLAAALGWDRVDLELKLDFYSQTNIFDLKLIANHLNIELEDNELIN